MRLGIKHLDLDDDDNRMLDENSAAFQAIRKITEENPRASEAKVRNLLKEIAAKDEDVLKAIVEDTFNLCMADLLTEETGLKITKKMFAKVSKEHPDATIDQLK